MRPTAEDNNSRPMSPDEIRQTPLRETTLGRRGYRFEDVDHFRKRLAAEVERWANAVTQSESEVRRLRGYYRRHGITTAAEEAAAVGADVSGDAVQLMARAQAYADQVVADAQTQARHVQLDARDQAESIMERARTEADRAGRAYRAGAGQTYSPDREEVERLAAWVRSVLATVRAGQQQFAATADALALELAKFGGQGAHSDVTAGLGGTLLFNSEARGSGNVSTSASRSYQSRARE
jgi:cell division septum initiation protein DivIVA